jgi:hypothetical protein
VAGEFSEVVPFMSADGVITGGGYILGEFQTGAAMQRNNDFIAANIAKL